MCFDPIHRPSTLSCPTIPLLLPFFHPISCPFTLGEGDPTGFIRIAHRILWEEGLFTEARQLTSTWKKKKKKNFFPSIAIINCLDILWHAGVERSFTGSSRSLHALWWDVGPLPYEWLQLLWVRVHQLCHAWKTSSTASCPFPWLSYSFHPLSLSFLGPCQEWYAGTI